MANLTKGFSITSGKSALPHILLCSSSSSKRTTDCVCFCMPPTDSYSRRRVINISNSEPKQPRAYLVLRKSTYKRQHATPQLLALLLVFREINFILGTALSNLCIITQRQRQLDQPGSGHTLQTPLRKYLVLHIWKWSWTSGLPLNWTHSFIMIFSMLVS